MRYTGKIHAGRISAGKAQEFGLRFIRVGNSQEVRLIYADLAWGMTFCYRNTALRQKEPKSPGMREGSYIELNTLTSLVIEVALKVVARRH